MTSEQFAKIFRGEITNWSQVGGSSQAIRLIDRPDNSDLRQAFVNYPVFQAVPFKTGANAVKLTEDSTEAVIKELGSDGIGYAIADQVINNPNVQIISMHKVPPTDPRYPFSQPLAYAYRGSNPSPAAKAFVGYATAPENQQIVEQARAAEVAVATPQATSSPTATATTSPDTTAIGTTAPTTTTTTTGTEPQRGFPWWWLLLIPLLGGLLWWLLGRRTTAPAPTPASAPVPIPVPPPPPARTRESRIVLTPRNCRDAYAYWEISDREKVDLQRQGGRDLKVRLYDVTDIEDMDRQTPHSMKEFDCDPREQDMHISIAVDNRDYIAELGYITYSGRWLPIARSAHVRVPACEPVSNIPATAAAAGVAATGVAAHTLVSDRPVVTKDKSRAILVPRNSSDAYAYWEIPEARKAELRQQGGRKLALRVYDTTGIDLDREPAHSIQQFDCDEQTPDLHIPITQSDRDYVAELGYVTDDGRWLKLARSTPVRVPSAPTLESTTTPSSGSGTNLAGVVSDRVDSISRATTNLAGNVTDRVTGTIAGGTAAVAGMGTAARSFLDRGQSDLDRDRTTSGQLAMKNDYRIILVPRNSRDAYAYWEVSDDYKANARQQGGRRFVLRIHDATNLDIDNQPPHSTQEYVCDERDQDKHVSIPVSDRDYIAEVGYYTDDNHWLRIIRSFHVHVPSDSTSP